jgi:hypothetical protein
MITRRLLAVVVGVSIVLGLVPGRSFAVEAANGTVCLQCHATQTGRGGVPLKEWQKSIHAENGISCHACHGGDPKDAANAMSPARGFRGVPKETAIPEFCGRCHVGIKDDYLASAHGRALGRGGPTCSTCHGSHGVVKANLELINEKRCSTCHPYQRAAAIKAALADTERNLTLVEQTLNRHKGEGVDTDAGEKRLFALKNQQHRLFHNVNTEKVRHETGLIKADLAKLQRTLEEIDNRQQRRKIAGALLIGCALFAALITWLLAKTYTGTTK